METKRGSGGEMSGAVQDPTSPESDELPLVQRILIHTRTPQKSRTRLAQDIHRPGSFSLTSPSPHHPPTIQRGPYEELPIHFGRLWARPGPRAASSSPAGEAAAYACQDAVPIASPVAPLPNPMAASHLSPRAECVLAARGAAPPAARSADSRADTGRRVSVAAAPARPFPPSPPADPLPAQPLRLSPVRNLAPSPPHGRGDSRSTRACPCSQARGSAFWS
eukprot:scaffold909_cov121-Isochrysis_galbana.AAC.7